MFKQATWLRFITLWNNRGARNSRVSRLRYKVRAGGRYAATPRINPPPPRTFRRLEFTLIPQQISCEKDLTSASQYCIHYTDVIILVYKIYEVIDGEPQRRADTRGFTAKIRISYILTKFHFADILIFAKISQLSVFPKYCFYSNFFKLPCAFVPVLHILL